MGIAEIILGAIVTIVVAALAEKSEGRKKKALWITFVVCVILLAALQIVERVQVANRESKAESDRRKESEEQRKNLGAVISQMGTLTTAVNQLQQHPSITGVPPRTPPAPATEEARLRGMGEHEFRQYALDWTKKLRNFETEFMNEESARFMAIPTFGADQAARDRYMAIYSSEAIRINAAHLDQYKNDYWGETKSIYDEIVRRYKHYGKPLPEPAQLLPFPVLAGGNLVKNTLNGGLAGPHPITDVADYLELLVRGLPS